jgi:ABC-type multidrug transport system fused ATPase/permease subunit
LPTTIRQALSLLGREQRKRWFLLLVLALATSLLEIVAAALVYILLGLVANPNGEVSLPLIGEIGSIAGGMDERTTILSLIGIMIAFFLVRAAVSMATEYITARVVNNAGARLSTRLLQGYLSLPYSFHLRRSSSELIRNGHQAVSEVVYSVFHPMIRVMAEGVMTIGILVLLVLVSPVGAALAVAVVGASTVVLLLIVQPRLKRSGSIAHAMQKEALASLQQSFHGVRDIKVLGREKFFSDVYGRARRRLARMMYIQQTLYQLPRVIIETSLIGFILVFFAVTIATGSEAQGALSILGLFGYAGLRLQPSLQRIAAGINSIRFSTAPVADIYRDLQMIGQNTAEDRSPDLAPFEHEIRLEHVSFSYQNSECEALVDVDLTIRRGEQVGICGPTGGGKSTLVDILSGLLTPTSGRVAVDGRDIADKTRGWQRNLGIVSQMVFLMDDSLRNNIALGISKADVDEAALDEAVGLARLDEFVKSLPEGLDTVVGERGVRLSGGERQRIAIARALYNRPQVLIFDEGTSALDNVTEQELIRSLRQLRGKHTILLVAHRLSTVRDADRVIFMKDGRVAGMDTFEELLRNNESFRQMAALR